MRYITTKNENLVGRIHQQKNGEVVIKFAFTPATNTDLKYVMKKLNLKDYV